MLTETASSHDGIGLRFTDTSCHRSRAMVIMLIGKIRYLINIATLSLGGIVVDLYAEGSEAE